jgi:peptidoglycan hydrolase CwlO-like protein
MQLEGADGFRKEAKERDSLIDNLKNQIEGLNNQIEGLKNQIEELNNQIRAREQMVWNIKNQK